MLWHFQSYAIQHSIRQHESLKHWIQNKSMKISHSLSFPDNKPHITCKEYNNQQPQNPLDTQISSPHFIGLLISFLDLMFNLLILSPIISYPYLLYIVLQDPTLTLQLGLDIVCSRVRLVCHLQHVAEGVVLGCELSINVGHLGLRCAAAVGHYVQTMMMIWSLLYNKLLDLVFT